MISKNFLPDNLGYLWKLIDWRHPGMIYQPGRKVALDGYPVLPESMKGALVVGPIPAGMPVNLLANVKLRAESRNPIDKIVNVWRLWSLAGELKKALPNATGKSGRALNDAFAGARGPLLSLSKCPDFVVNRGHLFGTEQFNRQDALSEDERAWGTETPLSDADKTALIAFLKTF